MTQQLKKTAAAVTAFATSAMTVAQAHAQGTITPPKGFFRDFSTLMNGILNFVMVIAALLVFVYLIWGGIDWITSGGDKGKTEAARSKITAAVIGLIVLAASYAILTIVLNFLGYDDINAVIQTNI